MNAPVLPGATIGVLGSGQLGRMLAIAARQMGYRVATLSPDTDTPLGQIADREVVADYDDLDAVRAFAGSVDVVTFEFENVSSAATAAAAERAPVYPNGQVLHTTQNRLREKTFLSANGFPTTPFAPVRSRADLDTAAGALGLPAVLKTAGFGYDGKGQRTVRSAADLDDAWAEVAGSDAEPALILEAFVDFASELSIVAARGRDGSFAAFPAVTNEHANHILDITTAPATLPPGVAARAEEIARGVLDALDVVGVLCVELFLTRAGELLINELAPRPHNSGHWTIEGSETSQFEQQLRAVCGLPLGSVALRRSGAAMANLLGDLWVSGEPDWAAALAIPGVHLHLYGKLQARPGRKMGHLTALADTPDDAAQIVRLARQRLTSF
jgi:5-(carboxyamino)imidazole ribonucleotide synthase